jgi:hypothetical protein
VVKPIKKNAKKNRHPEVNCRCLTNPNPNKPEWYEVLDFCHPSAHKDLHGDRGILAKEWYDHIMAKFGRIDDEILVRYAGVAPLNTTTMCSGGFTWHQAYVANVQDEGEKVCCPCVVRKFRDVDLTDIDPLFAAFAANPPSIPPTGSSGTLSARASASTSASSSQAVA